MSLVWLKIPLLWKSELSSNTQSVPHKSLFSLYILFCSLCLYLFYSRVIPVTVFWQGGVSYLPLSTPLPPTCWHSDPSHPLDSVDSIHLYCQSLLHYPVHSSCRLVGRAWWWACGPAHQHQPSGFRWIRWDWVFIGCPFSKFSSQLEGMSMSP